ncbi:hypothetical protein BVX93_00895, partial [bacterium B13(2017)]
MKNHDKEQQFFADGTSCLNRTGKKPFRSQYGNFIKSLCLILSFTMIWQSAVYAGAFDISFSAVNESRSHRRSRFFRPNDVKESSEKKRNLIIQRNALARNLNQFNRNQAKILGVTKKGLKQFEQNLNEAQRFREQMASDLEQAAKEAEEFAKKFAFHYTLAKPKTYKLLNGEEITVQKKTYFKGGQVIGVFGEVNEGRDGSISLKNTYNFKYDSGLASAQPAEYTSVTLDTNTGMVSVSEWSQGKYWTEEDVNNDDKSELETTSGHRVKDKLASYKETMTTYYPGLDSDFDVWETDVQSFLFLDQLHEVGNENTLWDRTNYEEGTFDISYLEEMGFQEGVTSQTERTEMRYYTEENERENRQHIKDQMASYHEERSSVEGRFSDTPALVSEVDWYDAEYDWAFKHEDDKDLVFREGVSEEYIEDFQRLESEKEQKRSISLITGYTEHMTDNIGHDSSRQWSTFIAGGASDDGTWDGESGYDQFGRVLEFKELSVSVEGTNESHRYDIEYWGMELYGEGEEETEYGQWFVENADEKQKRANYGQVKRYKEESNFSGGYA